jgi:hypothetical protein
MSQKNKNTSQNSSGTKQQAMCSIHDHEALGKVFPGLNFKQTKQSHKNVSDFAEAEIPTCKSNVAAKGGIVTELLVFSRCVSKPHSEEYVCLLLYTLFKGLSLNCSVLNNKLHGCPISLVIPVLDDDIVVEMDPQAKVGNSHADYFVYDHAHQVQLVVEAKFVYDEKHIFQLMGYMAHVHQEKLNAQTSSSQVVTTYGVLCDLSTWKFVKFSSSGNASSSSSSSSSNTVDVTVTRSRKFTLVVSIDPDDEYLGNDFDQIIDLICHIMGMELDDTAKGGIMECVGLKATTIIEAMHESQAKIDELLAKDIESQAKIDELLAKDIESQAKIDELLAKDIESQEANAKLQAKDDELLAKDKKQRTG